MSSKIEVKFEREDINDRLGRLHRFYIVVEKMRAKIGVSHTGIQYASIHSALESLSTEIDNPSFDAHPHDLFTFSYNGNSYSLTWEPACYTTDIGVI